MRMILAILAAIASPAQAQTVTTPQIVATACAYSSSLPTLVSGTFGLAQCDSSGRPIFVAPDGSNVAIGSTTDAAWGLSGPGTLVAIGKESDLLLNLINTNVQAPAALTANGSTVADAAPLPVKIGDGTNYATVKAASTAVAAADKSLVVQLSPNSVPQVQPAAGTTGGGTGYHLLSAATTNSTNVKSTAGTRYTILSINTTASIYYLKLYDKSTAPTCNTDTVLLNIPIPASTSGAGVSAPVPVGVAFSSGIGFCLTANAADNDNTAAATGVNINLVYK